MPAATHKIHCPRCCQSFAPETILSNRIKALEFKFILYACKSEEELQQSYLRVTDAGVVLAIIFGMFLITFIGFVIVVLIPILVAFR